ncbi:MAG: MoaD/ThiS family protein [Gammaproteobacteria bacterium]|nr:MoaD/ThiS family protein [Gammaproteobacteria bacterium]
MEVEFKLFASLSHYLPPTKTRNIVMIKVEEGTTPQDVINQHAIPMKDVHLVLVNGVYIYHEELGQHTLNHGDALAIWPPVAGG